MINSTRIFLAKLLPKNDFSKSVSMLMGGTIIIQLVQLMATPVLTRLYTPDSFGISASFLSTVTLLSIISCLSYDHAIPIPGDEKEAIGLVRLCFSLLSIMVFIFTLLMFFLGDYFLIKFDLHNLIAYKYILIVAVFLTGAFQIFNSFAIRERQFKKLSAINVYKGLALIIVQISASSLNALGLIAGYVISSFIGIFNLRKIYKGKVRLEEKVKPKTVLLTMRAVLKKYRKFPFYNMPNTMLNSVGRELPVILLTVFFSPAIAGFFFLANKITQQPISLVGGAIANVVKGNVPLVHRDGNLGLFFVEINKQLMRIFFIPLAILGAVFPSIFIFIFGQEWKEAGLISTILIPWVMMIALVNPISTIPQVLAKQEVALYFEILLLFLRAGGFLLGVYLESYILAISLFSFSAAIGIFIKMLWIAKISLAPIKSVLLSFIKELVFAIIVFLIVFELINKISFVFSAPITALIFGLFCLRSLIFLLRGNHFG